MLPVNLKVMDDDAAKESQDLSSAVLERNSDFRQFTERMRGMGRVFAINSRKDSSPRLVSPPPGGDDQDANPSTEWLDCCLREYLERKRVFENRYRSRKQLVLRVLGFLVPFLAVLWMIWPLWRVLIDVETDAFYKALGVPSTATSSEITRAYRSMMKRWHPDNNPNCGQYCRDQTERIKEAYNMLLSRGDHRFTLANQYHESLMALRSALSFRGFQISGDAAMGVYMVLSRLYPAGARKSGNMLRLGCSILILLFCTVHETLYVSGFNVATAIGLFYYCFSMAKASAQQQSMEETRRSSHFDVLRDAAMLLGAAAVTSVAVHWREHATVSAEEVFRMLYGSVYVLSFLYKFSPNVYDNFRMRKYSLPLTYVDTSSMRFTWTRFALSESSLLVDDLFVFTCRIPSPYRAVVYVTHFVCLCQLFMLPWDAPITTRRVAAKAPAHQTKESGVQTTVGGEAKERRQDGSHDVAQSTSRAPIAESPMTTEDEEVVTDLDNELVSWMDIATLKYKALILSLGRCYTAQRGANSDAVDVAPGTDLQTVNVFALERSNKPGTGPASQRLHVLSQVRDPEICRLIAQDRGPQMLMPSQPNTHWSIDMAREEYKRAFGDEAFLTNSQKWRQRKPLKLSTTWQTVLGASLVCFGVAVLCVVLGPSSFDVVRSSKGLDASLRPRIFARFAKVLPLKHFTNALSGGLLTAGDWTVCALDWWDAGATLGFIR